MAKLIDFIKSIYSKNFDSTLRKNFSWAILGNIVLAGSQWSILIIIARVGTAEMLGDFMYGLALAAPIFMFCNLQLSTVEATDAKNEFTFGDYLATRISTSVIAFAVLIIISFFTIDSNKLIIVVVAIGLQKYSDSVSDIIYGHFLRNEKLKFIAVSSITKGLSSSIIIFLFLYFTNSIIIGTIGYLISYLLALLFYDFYVMRKYFSVNKLYELVRSAKKAIMLKMIKISWPLGVVMMIFSLNTNIPRYVIKNILTSRDLGIFSAIAYFVLIGDTLIDALINSSSARLANSYVVGRKKFFTESLKIAAACASVGILGVIFSILIGKQVLLLVYGETFAAFSDVLPWIMLGASFGYVNAVFRIVFIAMRKIHIQIPINIATGVSMTIFCLLLVPKYGIMGAAFAMLFGRIIQFFVSGAALFVKSTR